MCINMAKALSVYTVIVILFSFSLYSDLWADATKTKQDIITLAGKVRRQGEKILKTEKDRTAVIAWLKKITDSPSTSEQQKIEAVETLALIKHKESVKILEDVLLFKWEPETSSSRSAVRTGRIKISKPKLLQSKQSEAKVRAKAAEALGTQGNERSIPILVRVAKEDKDTAVRKFSLKSLLLFKDPTLVEVFEYSATEDKSADNKLIGIVGMSKYPKRIRVQTVKTILEDKNMMVRLSGLKFLGVSKREDLLPMIIECAYDSRRHVKRRAADALSYFNTHSASEVLLLLTKDRHKGTVISAVSALGANTNTQGDTYLRIATRMDKDTGLIVLKSSFNMWKTLSEKEYEAVEDTLPITLRPTLSHVQKKVSTRKKIEGLSEQREKIKLSLTER
jgi:HEAT repeat protein